MPFGLYLHFPFCRNHCSYCDFYKEIYDQRLEERFFDALRVEVELVAEEHASSDRTISTIFVGGGTPSLVKLDRLSALMAQLRSSFDIPEGIEFSIENNPESVAEHNLRAFRDLGVNRPVFGIQSFHTKLLSLLNRHHNPEDSRRSVRLARELRYTNFGVDLIFGLPGQTSAMLAEDLERVFDLDPPHISFYQLTVETGTSLAAQVASGALAIPEQDECLELYQTGYEMIKRAGYVRYEVSSFAKCGFECLHNIGYWEGNDYLALGPSGHSFMNGQRFANCSDVSEYIQMLSRRKRPVIIDQSGPEERMVEAIMLGLRTSQGIDRRRFEQRFGCYMEARLETRQLTLLVESGHVNVDEICLRLTDQGICLADEIIRRLVL